MHEIVWWSHQALLFCKCFECIKNFFFWNQRSSLQYIINVALLHTSNWLQSDMGPYFFVLQAAFQFKMKHPHTLQTTHSWFCPHPHTDHHLWEGWTVPTLTRIHQIPQTYWKETRRNIPRVVRPRQDEQRQMKKMLLFLKSANKQRQGRRKKIVNKTPRRWTETSENNQSAENSVAEQRKVKKIVKNRSRVAEQRQVKHTNQTTNKLKECWQWTSLHGLLTPSWTKTNSPWRLQGRTLVANAWQDKTGMEMGAVSPTEQRTMSMGYKEDGCCVTHWTAHNVHGIHAAVKHFTASQMVPVIRVRASHAQTDSHSTPGKRRKGIQIGIPVSSCSPACWAWVVNEWLSTPPLSIEGSMSGHPPHHCPSSGQWVAIHPTTVHRAVNEWPSTPPLSIEWSMSGRPPHHCPLAVQSSPVPHIRHKIKSVH